MDDLVSPDDPTREGRRRTATIVNYAREQEFSDASDIFEDSEDSAPKAKKRGRPRKSDANEPTVSSSSQQHDDGEGFKKAAPVYTERGYDPGLLPIRERFPFLPEFEPDGSARMELIVGRRPIDEKEDNEDNEDDDNEDEKKEEDGEFSDDDNEGKRTRRTSKSSTRKGSPDRKKDKDSSSGLIEYEYLIKYKGRSYLHLEWKSGADLESMNKSAKSMYRRFVKKIGTGDEELEDPNVDDSFTTPQRICDEAKQEITVELSDKELLKWEKERLKELAEESSDSEDDTKKDEKEDEDSEKPAAATEDKGEKVGPEEKPDAEMKDVDEKEEDLTDWQEEDIDFKTLSLDRLRKIVNADGPYYPVFKDSNNPYRDGYVTEPPKKARASYLFFQCSLRSYYKKRNPNATQGELMSILGEAWGAMSDEEQAPFIQLAREEVAQHDKERALLEKAQKPNEVWQPIRRCRMVLNKVKADGFANIFLEPVNVDDFPDYEEFIDFPMDLATVEKRLGTKKYQSPEQFARDVRKIWNNCKIYNRHGSAIWHVADYMSKQFERLYHAWVLDFRERYLRWANPKARPWEQSCRQCDGKCNTTDDQLVVCDHCDAPYGFKCLPKPLKKLPKGVWNCVDCKPRLNTVKGIRMLSAVAEHAARKRAELGDTPKKTINQTMYLVKWEGLGYEFSTWETKEDISNPALLAKFHRLNNTHPDEPDMPESIVSKLITDTKHLSLKNAGGDSCVPDLRTQLYAQTRALQFSKFGMDLPDLLCSSCGPKTKAANTCQRSEGGVSTATNTEETAEANKSVSHTREVVECVSSLVDLVSKEDAIKLQVKISVTLPPLLTGEYDAIVPITAKGLMMNVGEIHGSVAFLGYRQFPDGSKGPSEINKLIRNVGDKIIAVDGQSTIKRSFQDVIGMLKESGKNKYAFMRFLETRFSVCDSDLASVGATGRYAFEELQKKFSIDRERLLVQRKLQLIEAQHELPEAAEESDGSAEADSGDESEEDSEGDFQPDSDAEVDELMKKRRGKISSPGGPDPMAAMPGHQQNVGSAQSMNGVAADQAKNPPPVSADKEEVVQPIVVRHEKTRSLAYRLLDLDVGNSSDEGGDDDCVFYVDGMDQTFTRSDDLKDLVAKPVKSEKVKPKTGKAEKEEEKEDTVPVKRNEFSELGERSKLAASILLAKEIPAQDDFDNFPYPSSKYLEETSKTEAAKQEEPSSPQAAPKEAKRSTVKLEQVDTSTNEIVHVWANAQSAAATLQLPLNELKQMLEASMVEDNYDEDLGDELGGFRWRFALAGATVTAGLETTGRGKKGREAWLEFRDKLYDPTEPHLYKNNNKLRDYQVDGVNWLASTYYKRHGCILADEMGLGKTVQIVSYIEHLYRVEKIKRPYIVVVPLSTVEHWRREFEGWTDIVCCIYHDRQRVWRDVLREYEWYYKDRPHTAEFLKFDVLVTTYDTLIGDFDVISQIPFRVSVVDEAHRLRNQKGKLLECMREISAKGNLQYGFQSRVLMSGTPLQNDLTELWTLLNFIEPFNFPDLDDFNHNFGNMRSKEQVENLQKMISPYMLRRIKEDVATDIPSKEETVIDVELTSIQKQYYRAIFEHNHAFLSIGASRTNAPKLMNIQMELRKVCNHPFLLDGIEHRETDRQYKEYSENGDFEGKTPEEQHHMLNVSGMIMSSGKMVLLDKLLPKLRQEGHKILIFSQMVKMLDLISEYCEFRSYPIEKLDGRVRGTERQKSIDRFENDPNSFLFLLSTRAGGVGINLTAADICIIFDSDWNPQNDVQAQARCHRIGQTKDVKIFRLVTSNTFEQEMFDRASKKLGLEQAVLGTFEQANEDDKPTNKEMEQLLKKGAYALLGDENDEAGKAFCADDIENILAKRTRTRVVEGAKTASWLNKQGMVVSKSKFNSESGAKLDMDDPLFWQKVMPDFVTPSIMVQKLDELKEAILGKSPKKGPGRGHGRWKKKREAEAAAAAAEAAAALAAEENRGDGQENPAADGQWGETAVEDGKTEEKSAEDTKADQNEKTDAMEVDDTSPVGEAKADAMEVDTLPTGEEAKTNVEKPKEEVGEEKETSEQPDETEKEEAVEGELENDDNKEEEDDEKETSEQSDEAEKEEVAEGEPENDDDKEEGDNDEDDEDDEEEDEEEKEKKKQLTRTNQRKVAKYISDLKSMMESVIDEAEDGSLPNIEKTTCQELLLQISINEKIFTEQQRHYARSTLKRLEGDRRRRCRTSDASAFTPGRSRRGDDDAPEAVIPEELRIVGTKKVKRKRRKKWEMERDRLAEEQKQNSDSELDEDGYLRHSDSEGDWSETLVGKNKNSISRKEAKRRRVWAADDDAATAAGRPWPVFPRSLVSKVLRTVLEEVMKYDDSVEGVFSVPVPKDEFPEYYEQVKKPMDYSTIKEKLDKGEYRSAQAMQKDFILVMQNCLQFNSPDSDIVKEARQQALMRPSILRKAAQKHNLFLSEDGSVLEVVDEQEKEQPQKGEKQKRRRRNKNGELVWGDLLEDNEAKEQPQKVEKKKRRRRNKHGELVWGDLLDDDSDVEDKSKKSATKRKPRIHISMASKNGKGNSEPGTDKKVKKRRRRKNGDADDENSPRKKRKKPNSPKPSTAAESSDDDSHDDVPIKAMKAAESKRAKAKDDTESKQESEKGEPEGTESSSIFMDVEYWKVEREKLDGSFMSARALFAKHGPWDLPEVNTERKFRLIAKSTLVKMDRHDGYSVFADAVSDSDAPGYSDVITQPMDFAQMRANVEAKKYGTGPEAFKSLYEDFLKVFDNCYAYNDADGDVITEAARVFGHLPEAFATSAAAVAKR